MEILFATSEIAPYSRSCEVAEVCAALAKALHVLGHSVTVLSPLYKDVEPAVFSLARRLSALQVELGGRVYEYELYDGRTAGGVNLIFVGNHELFSDQTPGPSDGSEPSGLRAALFSRAVIEVAKSFDPLPSVLHAHDWLAALTLVWAKSLLPRVPRVLSLHDPRRQGRLGVSVAGRLGLGEPMTQAAEQQGEINLLKSAIADAHLVVAVSQASAAELVQEGLGFGLEAGLGSLGEKLVGIVNGLDASIWNPLTDVHLKSRFHPNDLSGKQRCKAALQHELKLPLRPEVPLLAAVGALGWDQGGDLLAQAAEGVLRNDVQLAIAGEDDGIEVLGLLRELCGRFADRVQVISGCEEALMHRVIAAADLLLVPCRFEPCGALQMCAHRYGTLPVVRRTGSLEDTVVDCDNSLQTGSGFVFEQDDAQELLAAINRAVAAFAKREAFEALRRRVMRIDHSWERSARRYELLYKNLAGV